MKFKYIYILILSTIICTEIIASEYELNNIMLKNRNFLDEQNNFNRNKVRLKNTVKNDSTIVDLEKAIIFFNNLIKNKKSIFLTGFSKEPFINNDDDNSSEQIFEGNSNNKYYNSVYAVNYYYGEIKRVPISLNRKLRLIPTKLDIDNSLVIAKLNLKEDSDNDDKKLKYIDDHDDAKIEYYIKFNSIMLSEISTKPVEFNDNNIVLQTHIFGQLLKSYGLSKKESVDFYKKMSYNILYESLQDYEFIDEFEKKEFYDELFYKIYYKFTNSQNLFSIYPNNIYLTFKAQFGEYDFTNEKFEVKFKDLLDYSNFFQGCRFNINLMNETLGFFNVGRFEFNQKPNFTFNIKAPYAPARELIKSLNSKRELFVKMKLQPVLLDNLSTYDSNILNYKVAEIFSDNSLDFKNSIKWGK